MSAFDIPPHARRTTHLAMGLLALVAMAAFTQGFLKQLQSDTPAPPPRPNAAYADIAEATAAPTPALQVAERPRARKAAEPQDITADLPAGPLAADASAVPAPVAADAAATAPEPPAAAPAPPPAPEEAPT